MTDAIKRKLQEEINALEHELIHELPKEIKKAAALGDLSENAEYHMAKQRQEFVKARVRQLGKRLADLSMVNMNNIPHDKVGLGSTVKVYDNTKGEEVIKLAPVKSLMLPRENLDYQSHRTRAIK
jgi:transcription elongation factor GreA